MSQDINIVKTFPLSLPSCSSTNSSAHLHGTCFIHTNQRLATTEKKTKTFNDWQQRKTLNGWPGKFIQVTAQVISDVCWSDINE
jgi:hypothetical protein